MSADQAVLAANLARTVDIAPAAIVEMTASAALVARPEVNAFALLMNAIAVNIALERDVIRENVVMVLTLKDAVVETPKHPAASAVHQGNANAATPVKTELLALATLVSAATAATHVKVKNMPRRQETAVVETPKHPAVSAAHQGSANAATPVKTELLALATLVSAATAALETRSLNQKPRLAVAAEGTNP